MYVCIYEGKQIYCLFINQRRENITRTASVSSSPLQLYPAIDRSLTLAMPGYNDSSLRSSASESPPRTPVVLHILTRIVVKPRALHELGKRRRPAITRIAIAPPTTIT